MADSFPKRLFRAFKWHWNLLAFGAGTAVALLSGRPDMLLPLVAAGELAYLGFIGLHPRFQNLLQGIDLKRKREREESQRKLTHLISFLGEKERNRFGKLHARCVDFARLRDRIQHDSDRSVLADLQTGSLDKMLWLFLKLLHHKTGLDRFLQSIDAEKLSTELAGASAGLEAAREANRNQQLLRSLEEKRDAIEERLENYRKAEESLELLIAELDKTEQRIAHISEMGMTNRAPTDLGAQIDGIAASMASSERALGDLSTSFDFEDDLVPELVEESAETIMPPPLPLSE